MEEGEEEPGEREEVAGDAWISAWLSCSGLTRGAWEAAWGSLGSWEGGRGDLCQDLNIKISRYLC